MTNAERLNALKENKKFINKAFWAYNWSIPMNFTRERMLGCSMVCMLARVAEDIYPNDIEGQKELCRNHEVFFNTQQGLGAVINTRRKPISLPMGCKPLFFKNQAHISCIS